MNLEDWIDRVKRVRDRNFIDELQVRAFLSKRRNYAKKKKVYRYFFSIFSFCAEYGIC